MTSNTKRNTISRLLCLVVAVVGFFTAGVLTASAVADAKTFTLVIDAGHGGNDPGAVGTVAKEKTINLNVALAFGRLVEQNCPDVKVIYTRKTDVFVTLQERANIANRNKADLFISIHTNAVASNKGGVYGAETYTLGMHRAADNLEVAKRENSVITMESDYKTKYQGFDPNKAESYIIFELMQDKNMAQSVKLAKAIQQQYRATGRTDKGVHQAGFLVLRETSMPSVLTELGFISNPNEEAFLNSSDGVNKLANGIYNGFRKYRNLLTADTEQAPEDAPDGRLVAEVETTAAAVAELVAAESPAVAEVVSDAAPAVTVVDSHFSEGASATQLVHEDVVPSVHPVRVKPYPVETHAADDAPMSAPAVAEAAPATTAPAVEQPKPAEPSAPAKKQDAAPARNEVAAAQQAVETIKQDAAPAKSEPVPAVAQTKPAAPAAQPAAASAAVPEFRIQLLTSEREITEGDARLKGLPVNYYKDGTTYKYTYGASADYDEIVRLKKSIADKFQGVFVIALLDGKRIDLQEAIRMSKQK